MKFLTLGPISFTTITGGNLWVTVTDLYQLEKIVPEVDTSRTNTLKVIIGSLNSQDASRMSQTNSLILERRKQPREVKRWAQSHTACPPRSSYAQSDSLSQIHQASCHWGEDPNLWWHLRHFQRSAHPPVFVGSLGQFSSWDRLSG